MSDDEPSALVSVNSARFLAARARDAQTMDPTPPMAYALPGALAPIAADRLEAHQDDGLGSHEIVAYENDRHLKAHPEIAKRREAWTLGPYAAMVQAQQEIEAERRQQEAEQIKAYEQRLNEILGRRNASDA